MICMQYYLSYFSITAAHTMNKSSFGEEYNTSYYTWTSHSITEGSQGRH